MNALRKHLFIVLSTLLVLIAGSLFAAPQQAHADTDYQNETLVGDLGLPQEVVGVMIKNSLDANGNTPNVSTSTVTVGDISQWQTVSLANRKQNADGTYTSSTNATVAAWFAGLKTSSDNQVETKDMILYQDMSENLGNNFTGPKMLTDGIPANYGHAAYSAADLPIFNKMMALLMCATDAKTIDLTGIVSQVSDPAIRIKMLAMFRTDDMKSLTELDLGYNNFGPAVGTSGWGYYSFYSNTLHSSTVETWNLSYEGLAALDSQLLMNIGNQTRNVNLASNSLITIDWNNGNWLAGPGDDGNIDLSENTQINSRDRNTLDVLLKVSGNGSTTVLPDTVANDMVTAAIAANVGQSLSAAVLNNVAAQLDTDSLVALVNYATGQGQYEGFKEILASDDFDVSKLSASALQGLSDAEYTALKNTLSTKNQTAVETKKDDATGGSTGSTANLATSGAWQFVYQLGTDASAIKGIGALNLSGTLPNGQSLMLSMAPWTSGKTQINPTINFDLRNTSVSVTANGSVQTVQDNRSGQDMPLNLAISDPTLSLSADQVTNLTSQQDFNGVLVWTIQNVPVVPR